MPDKSALQIIGEELPQFWQGEQAAGMRGMVKGLGDLLGIGGRAEPESVMSRYPSEENAVRSLTPIIATAAPAARAAAPLARLAMRNPLATGAALTYATEDPTMMLANPASILASYTPEAEAVIKPKGGNWLNSVERALNHIKSGRGGPTVAEREAELSRYVPGSVRYEQLAQDIIPLARRNEAWDNWVGGPLTKYVKTHMGTAEDPVRALAEQGILHVNPQELNISQYGINSHPALMGKSPEAKSWEAASDLVINQLKPSELPEQAIKENPWLTKLSPDEQVYGIIDYPNFYSDLGFTHIKDELRGAMNPNTTLPENLRLKPEDLKQMGMEKAVRHVAAINAWREAQQAEANMAKAMNPATHTVKEYPEGYKLVELKAPKNEVMVPGEYSDPVFDIPPREQERIRDRAARDIERLGLNDESDEFMFAMQHRIQELSNEYAAKNKPQISKSLEEALKYEGDIMGHCVGGYCDPVMKGESQIFSLRDAKGRPHVTIETRPGRFSGVPREEFKSVADMTPEEYAAEIERISPHATTTQESAIKDKWLVHPQMPYFIAEKDLQPAIVQIKGKGNKAPAEKYQPMIQDFIRSQEWGDIGDLANSGFVRGPEGKAMTRDEVLQEFENLPEKIKNSGMVQERMNWLRNDPETAANHDFGYTLDYLRKAHPEHFAVGGLVQPAHFDDLTAFLSR